MVNGEITLAGTGRELLARPECAPPIWRAGGTEVGTMRILMLCTKYPLDPNDRYMTNELAAAFAADGHAVQVVATDWDASPGDLPRLARPQPGVDVLVVSATVVRGFGRFIRNASKWTLSSLFALRHMRRTIRGQRFDVTVCFTPCVTIAAQLLWATQRWAACRLAKQSILIVFDFFPYHHRSIELVPGGPVFAAARLFETALVRRFHAIGCTTPANMAYLKAHYRLRPEQKVVLTPLWSETAPPPVRPRETVRSQHGLPSDCRIIVFGGQITEGRGVDEMLAVAAMAEQVRPDLAFLFVGDGRTRPSDRATHRLGRQQRAPEEALSA